MIIGILKYNIHIVDDCKLLYMVGFSDNKTVPLNSFRNVLPDVTASDASHTRITHTVTSLINFISQTITMSSRKC